jgi:hypothetical protein
MKTDFDTSVEPVTPQPPQAECLPPGARPIVLTDSPDVVELKNEFRRLDEFEEEQKTKITVLRADLEIIRQRKADIAKFIFKTP